MALTDQNSDSVGNFAATLLIVDDDLQLLAAIKRTLEQNGYAAVCAENGSKAVATLEEYAKDPNRPEFQAVLSDLMMPQMDGLSLLGIIRSGRFKNLPFIILSGALDKESVKKLIQLGVDGILYKPFDGKKLFATLRSAVLRRQDKILNSI